MRPRMVGGKVANCLSSKVATLHPFSSVASSGGDQIATLPLLEVAMWQSDLRPSFVGLQPSSRWDHRLTEPVYPDFLTSCLICKVSTNSTAGLIKAGRWITPTSARLLLGL